MLNDVAREGIARVIDVLLPGTEQSPAATAVSGYDELLDRVLEADTSLAPIVVSCGERAAREAVFGIGDVEQWMGEETHRLTFALQAAYYMSKQVREAIHYPGQMRLPVAEATPDQICTPELIAPVLARGPIYLPAPE